MPNAQTPGGGLPAGLQLPVPPLTGPNPFLLPVQLLSALTGQAVEVVNLPLETVAAQVTALGGTATWALPGFVLTTSGPDPRGLPKGDFAWIRLLTPLPVVMGGLLTLGVSLKVPLKQGA